MSRLTIPITDRDHIKGPDNAALVLVEYGDYQCPFCAQAEFNLRSLEDSLSSKMSRVFRHFPLTEVHEYAFAAAMSAEAAENQGRFWEMHAMLFDNQEKFGPGSFEAFALELGLDLDEFQRDMMSQSLKNRIKNDFMGGVRSGVNGTPSFFLNGEKYEGPLDAESLIALAEAA